MANRGARRARYPIAAALLVCGCASDPPMKADHASAGYKADLATCRDTGDKAARHRVMSSGLLFLSYPVSLPLEERRETRKCLEAKGYGLQD